MNWTRASDSSPMEDGLKTEPDDAPIALTVGCARSIPISRGRTTAAVVPVSSVRTANPQRASRVFPKEVDLVRVYIDRAKVECFLESGLEVLVNGVQRLNASGSFALCCGPNKAHRTALALTASWLTGEPSSKV